MVNEMRGMSDKEKIRALKSFGITNHLDDC